MQEKERSGEVESERWKESKNDAKQMEARKEEGVVEGREDATVLVDRLEAHDLVVEELLQPLA